VPNYGGLTWREGVNGRKMRAEKSEIGVSSYFSALIFAASLPGE
jgi:hypothetical protein